MQLYFSLFNIVVVHTKADYYSIEKAMQFFILLLEMFFSTLNFNCGRKSVNVFIMKYHVLCEASDGIRHINL